MVVGRTSFLIRFPTLSGGAVKLREGSEKKNIWMFPKITVPQKGMVKIMENPIKMDDLGGKNPIFGNTHLKLHSFCPNIDCRFVFHQALQAAKTPAGQRSAEELRNLRFFVFGDPSNSKLQLLMANKSNKNILRSRDVTSFHAYVYKYVRTDKDMFA